MTYEVCLENFKRAEKEWSKERSKDWPNIKLTLSNLTTIFQGIIVTCTLYVPVDMFSSINIPVESVVVFLSLSTVTTTSLIPWSSDERTLPTTEKPWTWNGVYMIKIYENIHIVCIHNKNLIWEKSYSTSFRKPKENHYIRNRGW